MITFRPLDPTFAINQQIGIEAEPVVLVNIFLLERSDEAQFLKVWHDDATVMKGNLDVYPSSYIVRSVKMLPISTMRYGNPMPLFGLLFQIRSSGPA